MKHIILLLSLFSLCLAGCGRVGLDGLYPVKGVITSNGTPLEGVLIQISPVVRAEGHRGAAAQSRSDGTFTMTTLKANDGVFPGEYKVMISKRVSALTAEQIQEFAALGREPVVASVDVVPKKYQKAETSGFTLTVNAGSNPVWKIDIPEGLETPVFPKGTTYEEQMTRKPK
jgi:hypothetical protein